jgi:hypothetical protein
VYTSSNKTNKEDAMDFTKPKTDYIQQMEIDRAKHRDAISKSVLYDLCRRDNNLKDLPSVNLHAAFMEQSLLSVSLMDSPSFNFNDGAEIGDMILVSMIRHGDLVFQYDDDRNLHFSGAVSIVGGSWKNKIQALLKVAAGGNLGTLERIHLEMGSLNTGMFSDSHNYQKDIVVTWKFSAKKVRRFTPEDRYKKYSTPREPAEVWMIPTAQFIVNGPVGVSFHQSAQHPPGLYNPDDWPKDKLEIIFQTKYEMLALSEGYQYYIDRLKEVSDLLTDPNDIMSGEDKLVVDMAYPSYVHLLTPGDNGPYYRRNIDVNTSRAINAGYKSGIF